MPNVPQGAAHISLVHRRAPQAASARERHDVRLLEEWRDVRKIARDILGLDSAEQTGKINAKAVRIRHVIQKTLLGEATMSPERIALLRLMMAYGYGILRQDAA